MSQQDTTIESLTKEDGASPDMVQENIERLKEVFPEVFADGQIDFDALKETLGHYVDDREERYSFTWHGKSHARRIAQLPSTGALLPCPEESVNWDATKNIFIEGDNLEVLKLLQKSYHRKVKMIYIDPPYNTGKEFIYPDKWQDNLDTYLRYTGQVDDEGFKVSANTETSGRYHTNWLNMMYPRLRLARNLLADDGIVFISIDSTEVANLRMICSEIFGEECFIIDLIWQKRDGAPNDRTIGSVHDHILVYGKTFSQSSARTKAEQNLNLMPRTEKANAAYQVFREPNGPDPRGPFRKIDTTANAKGGRDVASLHYGVTNPVSGEVVYPRPGTCWRHAENEMNRLQSDNRLYWGVDGTATTPMRKLFLSEAKPGMTTPSILPGMPFNQHAARELEVLFGEKSIFDTPKPTGLLELLVRIGSSPGDTVLDFFAGSGSLGHAVMAMNADSQDGSRRYVLVQLPEEIDKALASSHRTVADIAKARLRAVSRPLREGQPKLSESTESADVGFKVFKLSSSSVKSWDASFDTIERDLADAIDNIKPDRSEADVLYELLLKYGLDLATPTEARSIDGRTVTVIGGGALVACLADHITLEVAEGIAALKAELRPEVMHVVFKDSGFKDDVVKTNAAQILRQAGVNDLKTL